MYSREVSASYAFFYSDADEALGVDKAVVQIDGWETALGFN